MEPGEVVPLPPASGTPIGILLDERGRLALTAEQIEKLSAIDDQLASRNAVLDGEQRATNRPPAPGGERGGPGGGRGGPGGGMGGPGGGMGGPGGGMGGPGGGMGGPGGGMGGPGGGRGRRGPPDGHGPPHDGPSRAKLDEEKRANFADAMRRAFDILDEAQRETAQKIFDERGVHSTQKAPPEPATAVEGGSVPDEP